MKLVHGTGNSRSCRGEGEEGGGEGWQAMHAERASEIGQSDGKLHTVGATPPPRRGGGATGSVTHRQGKTNRL